MPMRTAIFPAKLQYLCDICEFTGQAARDAGMNEDEVYDIQLAVDEACSNIVQHAYGSDCAGDIECTFDDTEEGLRIILRDHGKSFNPSRVPQPDIHADLDKRAVGGLGIFLMRAKMDVVSYESKGEAGNVLTLIKRRKQ